MQPDILDTGQIMSVVGIAMAATLMLLVFISLPKK